MGFSKRLYESMYCEEPTFTVGKEFANMLEKITKELEEEEKKEEEFLRLTRDGKLRNNSK